jgi:hypothetical protein
MKLLRILGKLLLVLAVIGILSLTAVIVLVKFKNQTLVASKLKKEVVRKPVLVKFMNLNEPGDGRFLYFDPRIDTLPVNLYYVRGFEPKDQAEDWINYMVFSTTSKDITVNKSLLDHVEKERYSLEDLNVIREIIIKGKKNKTSLNVVYLSRYLENPSNIGITVHRDTIFIFVEALNDLSEDIYRLDRLEQSTLMHEWGHLLNLPHTERDDCIMSEKVEVNNQHWLHGKEIVVEYCPETLRRNELDR